MPFTSFPCVICGEKRTKRSKGTKFKICDGCYVEIRSGVRERKGIYQSNCEICGAVIGKIQAVPACLVCRHKWYHHEELKRKVEEFLKTNDFSKLNIAVATLLRLGFEVIIKKVEK